MFFLFKIFLKRFKLKLFSFDSFLIINLKNRIMIIKKIDDKIFFFLNINILLSLYLYFLKINIILFLSILETILCLFIYNISKIKLCYFN